MKISPSLEDYLETIYILDTRTGEARVTDIAEKMGVAKSSVHVALHNLEDNGLLIHEKYGALKLTESGTSAAKKVYKRHVMLKKFFVDILDVEEKTAEHEACIIEHILSDETIEKISKLVKENGA